MHAQVCTFVCVRVRISPQNQRLYVSPMLYLYFPAVAMLPGHALAGTED